jgi:hypothetical protein
VVEKSKPGGGNIWCLPKESAILCWPPLQPGEQALDPGGSRRHARNGYL